MHRKALKEVKMPLGVSPLTELRVFIELLRPYSTAQKEEKLLKNKPFRFPHIVPSLVKYVNMGFEFCCFSAECSLYLLNSGSVY